MLASLIILLATVSPASRGEVDRIEKTCGAANKRSERDKRGQLLLGDTSGVVYPGAGEGTWRVFADRGELKKHSDESGAPTTQATFWRDPGGVSIAQMFFQSDSGDWVHIADYCFDSNGSLIRLFDTYNSFIAVEGGLSRERTTFFGSSGQVLSRWVRTTNLESKKEIREKFSGDEAPLYKRVGDLPFASVLRERGRTGR